VETFCFAHVRHAISIAMSVSVCLSVYPLACLKDTRSNFTNLCKYYLWPWLGAPLATMHYVIYLYFQFSGWRHHVCP